MSDTPPFPRPPVVTADHDIALKIAVAYLSNPSTAVSPEQVGAVIRDIFAAVSSPAPVLVEDAKPQPAVPISKSITNDYIVCLEDGKQLKMLKRYLQAQHGMTPNEYREKWGLPKDYPMVAPVYAHQRSSIAKQQGLGRKPIPAAKASRKRA